MPTRMCRICLGMIATTALLFISGCGEKPKPTGNLQGKVTFEGKAVEKAKLQIRSPKTGEAFAAIIGSSGSYKFDRPVTAGEYAASITPEYDVPVAGASKDPPPKPPERTDIPDKYRDPGKSGLTTTVKVGDNTYDVDMKK